MTIAEKLLPEVDQEFAGTRKLLALVPDDQLDWRPHPKSMELRHLAWHVSDFAEWLRDMMKQDVLVMTEQDGAAMMTIWHGKTRADMLARWDNDFSQAREALAKATDQDMANHWKMEWMGQVIVDDPREQVLRRWVISHMIHHRAQLGVYLRLLGIAIPGMDGPSADEAAMGPSA